MSGSNDLFGSQKSSNTFGGLFAKPSVIDNELLVIEKEKNILETKKQEQKQQAEEMDVDSEEDEVKDETPKTKTKKRKDDDDLEDRYMRKLIEEDVEDDDEEKEGNEEDSDDKEEGKEEDDENLEAKIIDLKQKEFGNAEKTIFIGNVPTSVMSSKKETKAFRRFINDFLKAPEGTNYIESIRFRSLHSKTNAPKKVAYISKEIDMEASMVSYVVFKEKDISLKAVKINGEVYSDHHLRVDHLTHPSKKDNKLSVFVGNVAFEETEEKLWKYFNEKLIEKKSNIKNVVENVRIVRDSKTSFGKGFAIVQFNDTNYVSKALLLDGKKLDGRPLRVTRCKKMKRNNDMVRKKTDGLNDKQKTIIGRAKVLNKSDRNTIGRLVIEGERAKAGGPRIKKPRHKKRLTKRSQAFKAKGGK